MFLSISSSLFISILIFSSTIISNVLHSSPSQTTLNTKRGTIKTSPIPINLKIQSNTDTQSIPSSSNLFKEILRRDSQRAKRNLLRSDEVSNDNEWLSAFTDRANGGPTIGIENDVVSYTAQLKVGTNDQIFNLIIDTGSSNTWIGAYQKLGQSNSTIQTGSDFQVSYGSGAVKGIQILENITLSDGLSIQQSIGVANQTRGFHEVDGILGVGPARLTLGTQSTSSIEVPTIMDTLYTERKIPNQILGVSFAPANYNKTLNGRMTLGGYDSNMFEDELIWIPRTITRPASFYWGVNVTMTCGSSVIVPNSAGIMDTGSTLLLISKQGLDRYIQSIPGASLDEDSITGLVKIPNSKVSQIPPFVIDFGMFKATLRGEEQLFPIEIAKLFGGQDGYRYSYLNSLGNTQGSGMDFIIGQKFMEYFYTAYDGTNNAVGIARSTISKPL